MLAYDCKNCRQIILGGCFNEYEEHFCNEKCYLEYCETNGYEPHIENLRYIKNIFSN